MKFWLRIYWKECIGVTVIIFLGAYFSIWSGRTIIEISPALKAEAIESCLEYSKRNVNVELDPDLVRFLPLGTNVSKVRKTGALLSWDNKAGTSEVKCVVAVIRNRTVVESFQVNGETIKDK